MSPVFAKIRPTLRLKSTVYTVDISPDEKRYLYGGGDPGEPCTVSVANVSPDKPLFVLQGHKKPIVRARFLDDRTIVSVSFDSEIRHWSADGDLLHSNEQRLSHRADACAISRDGRLVVIGDYQGKIAGWNPRTGTKLFEFAENGQKRPLWVAAVTPKRDRFATGGAAGVVRVWRVKDQSLAGEFALGHGQHIRGLAYSPNGRQLLVAAAPDGAANTGAKSQVLLCDSVKLKLTRTLDPYGQQPYCCAFSPDGSYAIASGGGNDRGGKDSESNCTINCWCIKGNGPDVTIIAHRGVVRDLAATSGNEWLISAGWDQTVRVSRIV